MLKVQFISTVQISSGNRGILNINPDLIRRVSATAA